MFEEVLLEKNENIVLFKIMDKIIKGVFVYLVRFKFWFELKLRVEDGKF